MNFPYVKAFESYGLTDIPGETDRHDRNYIPRRFAVFNYPD